MVKPNGVLTDKPDKRRTLPRQNGHWQETPLLVKLKARNLYLVQGLTHKEIASQTGLSLLASQQLASRNGWTELRRKSKERILAKQDAKLEEQSKEALDAIASVSEQHAVRGLERVGEALESYGDFSARDFQSWTGGVKNLVSIMREIRAPQEQAQVKGATLNMFIIRAGDAAVPAVAAAPVEVKATVVAPPLQPAQPA